MSVSLRMSMKISEFIIYNETVKSGRIRRFRGALIDPKMSAQTCFMGDLLLKKPKYSQKNTKNGENQPFAHLSADNRA